jgi:hypothetical protein
MIALELSDIMAETMPEMDAERPQLTVIEGGKIDMKPEEIEQAKAVLLDHSLVTEAADDDFTFDFARAYFFHSAENLNGQDPFEAAYAYALKLHPDYKKASADTVSADADLPAELVG